MKKMKKINLMFLLFVMIFSLTACNSKPEQKNPDEVIDQEVEEPEVEVIIEKEYPVGLTFDDVVKISDLSLNGTFIKQYEEGGFKVHEFNVNDIHFGNYTDSTIKIVSINNVFNFETNEEYVLMIQTRDTVFDGKSYFLSDGLVINYDEVMNEGIFVEKMGLNITKSDIDNLGQTTIYKQGEPANYIKSSNIEEIANFSNNIFEVNITAKGESSPHGSTIYYANVSDVVKGSKSYLETEVILVLESNSVEVGNDYVIMLTGSSDETIIFTQSSLDAIRSVDDKSIIKRSLK